MTSASQLPATNRADAHMPVIRAGRAIALAAMLLGLLAGSSAAPAGTSGGAATLLVQSGSGAPLTRGDYVSSAAGLNTYHSYLIEVPPGTASLQIDIFDLDVGANHDQVFSGGMFVGYTVINPNGAAVFGPANIPPNACPICDNAWINLFTQSAPPPIPGHWELRIDTSAAVTAGNDDQGYGVRAHDGDPSAGGRELNVYVDTFIKPGRVIAGTTNGRLHPYVTSGCEAQSNDFDWDQSPTPALSYSSLDPDPAMAPPARFSAGPLPSSGDGVWMNQPITGWTSDTSSSDYGIWGLQYGLTAPAMGDNNANSALLYMGAESAALPPPVVQPEPSSFRIYLPSDGGTPPVKPRIGQDIIGVVSGADPPATNQTTVLRIAIGIDNPTSYPITFSAPGNVVSVEVPFAPGNRVRYQGNASATQGTVVSQPAIDTSGTIVWNPGVVPAGGTAQLEYDLSVRPQPTDTRIVITGTPSANGTTATYLDETCSGGSCGVTALARATHTFGPLCELAITKGASLATLAVVEDLRAYHKNEGTVVEWTTLAEHATVGFHLLRLDPLSGDYIRINRQLLPAFLHSPNGGTYRHLDPGVDVGETHTYLLVEVEASGKRIHHGPYTVSVALRPGVGMRREEAASDAPLANFERAVHARPDMQKARLEARKAARRAARTAKRERVGSAAKVTVREPGLHYLPASDIARSLGLPSAAARSLIRNGRLSLSSRGASIAYLAAGDSRGIYFYGESVGAGESAGGAKDRRDDVYTHGNVYWLRTGPGLTMRETDGLRPAPAIGQRFLETIRIEGNKYSLTHLFDDPNGDYWMWDFRVGGMTFPDCAEVGAPLPCYVHGYSLPSPGVAAGSNQPAILTVNLHGGSDTPAELDHDVSISLNGETLGRMRWSGLEAHTAHFEVSHDVLRNEGNTVGIEAAGPGEGDFVSVVYLNDIELRYLRSFTATDGSLAIPSETPGTLTVDGFQSRDIWVFDITNPKRPLRVENAAVDHGASGYRVSFFAGGERRRYLAINPNAARAPIACEADRPSRLHATYHEIDYLVITDSTMVEAARAHADYRRTRGLRTMVVDIEDIYDEFNHGIANADAIWQFLRYAHATWRKPPRYVLLAGEGSYDFKDYLGHGDAIIPTLLAPTPRGLFPSDNLYVDVAGDDRRAEMAIGRIPVIDADELRAFTRKIIAYESAVSDAWTRRMLLVADAPDDGGNFPADSELISAAAPHDYIVERIYLDSVDAPAATRLLVDALNRGQAFMNFIGHGGSTAFGNRRLLGIGHLAWLTNGERLPVVTAETCLAGQFGFPGLDGIGELMVLRPDRGAIAVWAPSGLSMNNGARYLGQAFYRSTFDDGELVIGETILDAQSRYLDMQEDEHLLDIYNLIGDPATLMK